MNMNEISNTLYLCSLTAEQRQRTCGYWYTVTRGAMAHTAFRTKAALMAWLGDCGLSLTAAVPEKLGEHSTQAISGQYLQKMHGDYSDFYALPAIKEIRCMSNGDWTLGRITESDGIRTIHTLNPNCHHRPVFDWRTSQALQDAGQNEVIRDKYRGLPCCA